MGTDSIQELAVECRICGHTSRHPDGDLPGECPDCTGELNVTATYEVTDTGPCDVGKPGASVNCTRRASHKALIESEYSPEYTRPVCPDHAELWEGSNNVKQLSEIPEYEACEV